METRSKYGASQDAHFKLISFEMSNDDLNYYEGFARQLGFAKLKEYLEDQCQKALFALECDEELINKQMRNISLSKHALIV